MMSRARHYDGVFGDLMLVEPSLCAPDGVAYFRVYDTSGPHRFIHLNEYETTKLYKQLKKLLKRKAKQERKRK